MRFLTTVSTLALATAQLATATTDLDTLNYALTLENLESNFYSTGLGMYTETDFTNAGYDSSVRAMMVLIAGHEAAHVTFLKTVITSLGGNAAQPCSNYNFSPVTASVGNFVNSSYAIESLGVQAYDGAIDSISNPTIQQAAATIATMEARHATYLQQFAAPNMYLEATGSQNVPNGQGAFDNATDSTTVAANPTLDTLLNGGQCGNITLPVSRSLPSNYTTAYVSGTASTLQQNDVNALNYALFLEHFEAAFYAHYVGTSSSSTGAIGSQFDAMTLARLQMIANHEQAHVDFLTTALGSNAISVCSGYTWPTMSTAQFLSNASAIENEGVMAYDGAINSITNPGYAAAAATIATVEGRHADYLLMASGQTQFTADQGYNNGTGGAFDTAASPSSVAGVVSGLNMIPATCFNSVVLPSTVRSTSATAATQAPTKAPTGSAATASMHAGAVLVAAVAAVATMMA